jgi:hypothetical protein
MQAMARYEHLPIYRAAFDLAVHIEKLVRGFTRYHKYSLGSELRERSREILAGIIDANHGRDRAEPWARAQLCRVVRDSSGYGIVLVDDEGFAVNDRDVQLARIAAMNGSISPV